MMDTGESSAAQSMGGERRQGYLHRGFSLIELMITLLILVVLAFVAVPSFRDATLSSRLRSLANDLVASAYLARSEAIKRNVPVTLCASANGTSCAGSGDWEQGWIVLAGTTVIERAEPSPPGFRITGTGGLSLSFEPTGVGADTSTFTVCRATPSVGSQERLVLISPTGRPTVSRTDTGTCP